jgi:hypothetical protein
VQTKRIDEAHKLTWPQPPELVGANELNILKATWEPLLSEQLASSLFSMGAAKFGTPSQDAVAGGLQDLQAAITADQAHTWVQHTDLILRYLTYCLCLRESVTGLLKILGVYISVCTALKELNAQLTETELNFLLHHLIEQSGHKSERHRSLYKQCLSLTAEVTSPAKLFQAFYVGGLSCKNKKSRVVCLEEMASVVEHCGVSVLTKHAMKELAECLDGKDSDAGVRSACLDLCYTIYVAFGNDLGKLLKSMGELSERSTSMIEERVRQRGKSTQAPAAATATAHAPHPVSGAQSRASALASAAAAVNSVSSSINVPIVAPVMATPAKAVSYNVDDMDDLAFKLEMTPVNVNVNPKQQQQATRFSGPPAVAPVTISSFTPPLAANKYAASIRQSPLVNSPDSFTTADTSACVGIFKTIVERVDSYLLLDATTASEAQMVETANRCRDYVKLLHSIICRDKEFADTNAGGKSDTEAQLLQCVNVVTHKLLCCVALSFEGSTPVSPQNQATNTVAQALNIDVSLLSLSLACLFALIKRTDTMHALSRTSVSNVLRECLWRLADDRFNFTMNESDNGVVVDAVKQIINALNTIILKLSAEYPHVGVILSSLVDILRTTALSSSAGAYEKLRPTSRLVRRVLYEQSRKSSAFCESVTDTKQIILAINEYFTACPLSPAKRATAENSDDALDSDDAELIGYATVKTILRDIVQNVGLSGVNTILAQARIPSTATISRLAIQLHQQFGNSSEQQAQQEDEMMMEVVEEEEQDPARAEVVTIIEQLTAASDKMACIRKLHLFKRAHPHIDIVDVLQPVSSAFRRFVLDMLDKLDAEEADNATTPVEYENSAHAGNVHISVPPLPKPTNAAAGNDLTPVSSARKSLVKPADATADSNSARTLSCSSPSFLARSSSQRSLINDMVRGSLNSLTASLDGVNPAATLNSNSPNPASKAAGAPTVGAVDSNVGGIAAPVAATGGPSAVSSADQDLAARLLRLKAMQMGR